MHCSLRIGTRASYVGMADGETQLLLPGADWERIGPAQLRDPTDEQPQAEGTEVAR